MYNNEHQSSAIKKHTYHKPDVNVNINQEFVAWVKQPKLLQSLRERGCGNLNYPVFRKITSTYSFFHISMNDV